MRLTMSQNTQNEPQVWHNCYLSSSYFEKVDTFHCLWAKQPCQVNLLRPARGDELGEWRSEYLISQEGEEFPSLLDSQKMKIEISSPRTESKNFRRVIRVSRSWYHSLEWRTISDKEISIIRIRSLDGGYLLPILNDANSCLNSLRVTPFGAIYWNPSTVHEDSCSKDSQVIERRKAIHRQYPLSKYKGVMTKKPWGLLAIPCAFLLTNPGEVRGPRRTSWEWSNFPWRDILRPFIESNFLDKLRSIPWVCDCREPKVLPQGVRNVRIL